MKPNYRVINGIYSILLNFLNINWVSMRYLFLFLFERHAIPYHISLVGLLMCMCILCIFSFLVNAIVRFILYSKATSTTCVGVTYLQAVDWFRENDMELPAMKVIRWYDGQYALIPTVPYLGYPCRVRRYHGNNTTYKYQWMHPYEQ